MRSAWLGFLVLCASAAAQTAPPKAPQTTPTKAATVEITAEPFHHLVLKNQQVRVFAVEVPPKAETRMHRHRYNHVFVALGDSEVTDEHQGQKSEERRLNQGDVGFVEGGFAHRVRNLSDAPFRAVAIEVLKPVRGIVRLATCDVDEGIECGFCNVASARRQKCDWPGELDALPELEKREAAYGVYQFVMHMEPGSTTGPHHHTADHLLVAVSDLELKDEAEGRPPETLRMKSGEVRWVKGGFTHTLTNLGKPAWFVNFEFK